MGFSGATAAALECTVEPPAQQTTMIKQSDPRSFAIRRVDILCQTAQALIGELNAELSRTYPEQGACHFRLDADEVGPGRGAFVAAFYGERPIGCGAVRRVDDATGEVKRMYVVPDLRGKGVGKALVGAIEAEAKALGLTRLALETGVRQHAALALYERLGFKRIPPFGEYFNSPLSICMAKAL
jgi:putative acetyltransferase